MTQIVRERNKKDKVTKKYPATTTAEYDGVDSVGNYTKQVWRYENGDLVSVSLREITYY